MTVGSEAQSSQPDKRSARSMKKNLRFTDLESESGGSSEEFGSDSPRSVWKIHTDENTKTVLRRHHQQVLKIREEDSHLGEDIGEGFSLSAKEKLAFLKSNFDAFFRENQGFILRGASPLSGKTAIKSFN